MTDVKSWFEFPPGSGWSSVSFPLSTRFDAMSLRLLVIHKKSNCLYQTSRLETHLLQRSDLVILERMWIVFMELKTFYVINSTTGILRCVRLMIKCNISSWAFFRVLSALFCSIIKLETSLFWSKIVLLCLKKAKLRPSRAIALPCFWSTNAHHCVISARFLCQIFFSICRHPGLSALIWHCRCSVVYSAAVSGCISALTQPTHLKRV